MKPHDGDRGRLSGLRVLVVEDEALISMYLEDILLELGCALVGPAMSVRAARAVLDSDAEFDAAILDVNVAGQPVYPIAQLLADRGRPFVFTTGYGIEGLLKEWRHRPTVQKPFTGAEIEAALTRAIAGAG